MKAMILAAGYGQRFRPHTLQLAKPALPFLDLPIITYSIHYLSFMGAEEFIINLHYLPDTVKKVVEDLPLSQSVSWSFEPHILNSGGGIKNVESFFYGEDDFLVANADSIVSATDEDFLRKFVNQHKRNQAMATFLSCPHKGLGDQYGALWCDKEDRVQFVGKRATDSGLLPQHYTGLMILSQKIFEYLPEGSSDIFLDAIMPAIQNGELIQSFYVDDIQWFETGDLNSYLDTQKKLLARMRPSHPHFDFLSSPHQRFLNYRLEIDDSLQWISPQATIDGTIQMGHNVVICSRAQLGKNIQIDDSVVSWDHSLSHRTIHSEMVL